MDQDDSEKAEGYLGDGFWAIKNIVDERNHGREFKVSWEGHNPKTGRPWPDQWIQESWGVTKAAKDAWRKAKEG